MAAKVRHIDYYPDEYIAGIGGRLSAVEQGVYWMICSLVYSRGGPIDDDHVWLSRLFSDTHWRTVRTTIERLIELGKVDRVEGSERPQITVMRCARELQKALNRSSQASQNGGKGGRPPRKDNDLTEPEAFSDEKLTTNHQPPTSKTSSLRSDAKAKAKNTRLSPEWEPSDEDRAYAVAQGIPGSDVDRYAEEFRNYWVSQPGRKGVKADWPATWRNRVLQICERRGYAPLFAATNGHAKPQPPKDDREAENRLRVGRERKQWPRAKWGPAPGELGCLIPSHLLKPNDGDGWAEWTGK